MRCVPWLCIAYNVRRKGCRGFGRGLYWGAKQGGSVRLWGVHGLLQGMARSVCCRHWRVQECCAARRGSMEAGQCGPKELGGEGLAHEYRYMGVCGSPSWEVEQKYKICRKCGRLIVIQVMTAG